ncbi:hypothetical protein NX059_007588 [Plenodomus lindquistii]|nr:hypothetical protein NX059_007588 [Plenodomus lindquistii]
MDTFNSQRQDLPLTQALRAAHQAVTLLLDPPSSSFHINERSPNKFPGTVRISLWWAINAVGGSHFTRRIGNNRPVLKYDSFIKKHGRAAGLPEGYYLWLVGHGREPEKPGSQMVAFYEYYMHETQLLRVSTAIGAQLELLADHG